MDGSFEMSNVSDGSRSRRVGHLPGPQWGPPLLARRDEESSASKRNVLREEPESVTRTREVLWQWCKLLENAAASEIMVNVCLPWMLCESVDGARQAPSDLSIGVLVLTLNLGGSFLEGVFKSTGLLSRALRQTSFSHQLVYISSRSFCDGFLNVVTSFPDVAVSACSISMATGNRSLGCLFCSLHLMAGVLCYRWGRLVGWRYVLTRWSSVVQFCRWWPLFMRSFILVVPPLVLIVPNLSGRSVPLDLTSPQSSGVEFQMVYDDVAVSLPPPLVGLFVGMCMSFFGAAAACLCCERCAEHKKSAARFLTNLTATVLMLLVQEVRPDSDVTSFILLKFTTSFCGALSTFSGAVSDVGDAYFGASPKERSPSGGWLPSLRCTINFIGHWCLMVVVMSFSFSSKMEEQVEPILLRQHKRHHFALEQEPTAWHLLVT